MPYELLMVANNGLACDYSFDRKGFDLAIQAANELDMKLTIIGAEANAEFFKIKKYPDNPKIRFISYNPTEYYIAREYMNGYIFLHPSMLEAGHPNLTILEALSSQVPVVGTYMGSKELPGMYVLPGLSVKELVEGIKTVKENYEQYQNDCLKVREEYDWKYYLQSVN